MTSAMSVPITQDVLTIPRKLAEGGRTNIVGLTRAALREALIAAGTPEKQAKMRLGQVWQWVYHWGVRDFALMTNLAKDYRALLEQNFCIELPEVVTRQISEDGTRKYLVRIAGGMCPTSPTAITCARPFASMRIVVMLAFSIDIASHAPVSTPSARVTR